MIPRATPEGADRNLSLRLSPMSMSRIFLLYLAAISFIPCGEAAFAHAIVVVSSPAPNETVAASETEVEVRFNSRVDRERSRLTLVDPGGASVVLPLAAGATAETLKSHATGLDNGRYRLLWQTLSVDGHITHGEIPFQVKR